ncbi:MAG: Wzz/FepE/Etk N-terminal domain-containing protein [Elusimicrobiota bacterium]
MQSEERLSEEQEVNLGEYLRILFKNWKQIAYFTFFFFIVSIIYSLLVTNIYESVALIDPAKIQKVTVESAQTLEVLFKNPLNPYLAEIAKRLNLSDEKAYDLPKNFRIVDKSGFVSVSGKWSTPVVSKKLVDAICSLILERYQILLTPAVEIVNNEISFLNLQISSTKEEIDRFNSKILTKEKTGVVAQAYVYQSMIEARENAMARLSNLTERLREREMEKKYFTKPAFIVAEATVPKIRIYPKRKKMVLTSTSIGFILSILLTFVFEYLKKELIVKK